MKILVYHPTGNENVRALLRALKKSDMLHSFHTAIAVFESSWYYRFLRGKLSRFKRRTCDSNIKKQTKLYPFLELLMFAGVKRFKGKEITSGYINLTLSGKVARGMTNVANQVDGVYCYPHGAKQIFEVAKQQKKICFYEQTTAYYKEFEQIVSKEKELNPDWMNTITMYKSLDRVLFDQLTEELNLCDVIVAPSTYVKNTLLKFGFQDSKIKVIPYGFPDVSEKKYPKGKSNKLNLLFVGNISQLKGISYLFEAIGQLHEKVNLTLVGNISNSKNPFLIENLNKYNYKGTMSHNQVMKEMRRHDILIFPTLSDGYGLVINEAMSQGTPVITTPCSGGPDVIIDKVNGWIIPAASVEPMVDLLNELYANPHLLQEVSSNAFKTAQSRPWAVYEKEVTSFIKKSMN